MSGVCGGCRAGVGVCGAGVGDLGRVWLCVRRVTASNNQQNTEPEALNL